MPNCDMTFDSIGMLVVMLLVVACVCVILFGPVFIPCDHPWVYFARDDEDNHLWQCAYCDKVSRDLKTYCRPEEDPAIARMIAASRAAKNLGVQNKLTNSCCCNYGGAVSGEYPEFPCGKCPVHKDGTGTCKRHSK